MPIDLSHDVPTPEEIARIASVADPVLQNIEITNGYWRLSQAVARRTGAHANWCTFGIWASRQAGATIRGEDLMDRFRRRLGRRPELFRPIRSLWRWLLRRGLLHPETRLGAVIRRIHTPFDALERTSEAVARGNLRVFAEIGGRGPGGAALGALVAAVRRHSERVTREVITEALMLLTLPDGTVLSLGRRLDLPILPALQSPAAEEFRALRARFARTATDVEDWAVLDQRMGFILHLFCALHARADLFSPPFTSEQLAQLRAGRLSDGLL